MYTNKKEAYDMSRCSSIGLCGVHGVPLFNEEAKTVKAIITRSTMYGKCSRFISNCDVTVTLH